MPRDYHGSNHVSNVLLQRATASNQVVALDKPELLGPPRHRSRCAQESNRRQRQTADRVFVGPRKRDRVLPASPPLLPPRPASRTAHRSPPAIPPMTRCQPCSLRRHEPMREVMALAVAPASGACSAAASPGIVRNWLPQAPSDRPEQLLERIGWLHPHAMRFPVHSRARGFAYPAPTGTLHHASSSSSSSSFYPSSPS